MNVPDAVCVTIGVDIGGTFTDVVAIRDSREVFAAKVPSTPSDLIAGVAAGVTEVLDRADVQPSAVERLVHGTTVATNAVLEQTGSRLAVLTTDGFEDVLEIGRMKRSATYDLFIDAQTPTFLAPRERRYPISERVDPRGKVILPLDEDSVRRAVHDAVTSYQVDAIAVAYLFSFINPEHELRTRQIIRDDWPHLGVSLSGEVHPVMREYERTVVTGFDAYVRPVMERYLSRLEEGLREAGVTAVVHVMGSRGSISGLANAVAQPVSLLLSGPAGGVVGGRYEGSRSGCPSIITLDMGGTSSDVALVEDGTPLTTASSRIGDFPLPVPMIDVSTIGAGGGSVAWLDAGGGLRVGPESAGADPGPACYGRGGTRPTVTDASVVLGYLNSKYFAGGSMDLDADAAHRSMASLGVALGLSPIETALGVHRVVNAAMADQLRLVSVQRGRDPRHFALVLLGGAGPVHGALLADELEMPAVLVPSRPGVLSALGLLVAPIEHHHMRTLAILADNATVPAMRSILSDLDRAGRTKMHRDGARDDDIAIAVSADVRYLGQSYELEVPIALPITNDAVRRLVMAFHEFHQKVYGHSSDRPVELVNLRVVHSSRVAPPQLRNPSQRKPGVSPRAKCERTAYFHQAPAGVRVPVYERNQLVPPDAIPGPAIIEQEDTTTVVYPGYLATMDEKGNLFLRKPEAAIASSAPAEG